MHGAMQLDGNGDRGVLTEQSRCLLPVLDLECTCTGSGSKNWPSHKCSLERCGLYIPETFCYRKVTSTCSAQILCICSKTGILIYSYSRLSKLLFHYS